MSKFAYELVQCYKLIKSATSLQNLFVMAALAICISVESRINMDVMEKMP